jgi:hypothetical protein
MSVIASIKRQRYLNLLHRQGLHGATVIHLSYVDIQLRDEGQKPFQLTWTVSEQCTQDDDASLDKQAVFNEAPKQAHIDITSGEYHDYRFASQVQQSGVQHRCQAHCSSTLDLQFTAFQ